MSHRFETLALQVVRTRVAEYKYFMDDKHTGYLYLLDGPQKGKKCMWLSMKTNLYTKWHGKWFITPDGGVLAQFDYGGKTNRKWTEFDEGGTGEDYRGRTIRVQFTRLWQFDPATSTYLDELV